MITVLNFDVKSKDGDSTLSILNFLINWTNAVQTMYLFEGDTLLQSVAVTNSNQVYLNMENFAVTIPKDGERTFTLKINMSAAALNSTVISAYLIDLLYEQPNGVKRSASGMALGDTMYLYPAIAEWSPRLAPKVTLVLQNQNQSIAAVATFTLRMNAVGGNVRSPIGSDFRVIFTNIENGMSYIATSTVVATNPMVDTVPEGAYVNVVVTSTILHPEFTRRSMILAKIDSIKWQVIGQPETSQRWDLSKMVSEPTNIFFEPGKTLHTIAGSRAEAGIQDMFILTFRAPQGDLIFEYSEDLKVWHPASYMFGEILQEMPDESRIYTYGLLHPQQKPKLFFRVKQ